ncbi:Selenocysteine-containing peroxiredoxin PrxU [Planctomycetaceae bacterium]|nr:Selenocysteine-containing peroxiredoxin PrxU [Planctomycetaceae bacterium]
MLQEIQMAISVGHKAPAFSGKACVSGAFKDIKLEDYKGKWVVLYFFPLAFTGV